MGVHLEFGLFNVYAESCIKRAVRARLRQQSWRRAQLVPECPGLGAETAPLRSNANQYLLGNDVR